MSFSASPIVSGVGTQASPLTLNTTGVDIIAAFVGNYTGSIVFSDGHTTFGSTTLQTDVIEGKLFYASSGAAGWAVGAGHQFTCGDTNSSMAVLCFSGAHASAFHAQNGAANHGASSLSPGSVTPVEGNTAAVTPTWSFATSSFQCSSIAAFKAADGSNELIVTGLTLFSPVGCSIDAGFSTPVEIHSGFLSAAISFFIPTGGGGGGRTSKNTRSNPLGTALGIGLGIPGVYSAPMACRKSGIYVPERMAA